jgi:HD superfamily phosphohydrolase
MPNFICEELVYKNGKVDIVEQEFSKLWNDKIKMLERENKELKEENEIMKTTWLCQADVDEIIFRQLKEIKTMKNKCLKSVSKLSKKIKELQEQVEQLEEDAGLDDNEELEEAPREVDSECDKKEQVVIPEAKADTPQDKYEKLSSGEYWNKSNNRIYDKPGRNSVGAMVLEGAHDWVKYYFPCD